MEHNGWAEQSPAAEPSTSTHPHSSHSISHSPIEQKIQNQYQHAKFLHENSYARDSPLHESPQTSPTDPNFPSHSTSTDPTYPIYSSNNNSPHSSHPTTPTRDHFYPAPPLQASHSNTNTSRFSTTPTLSVHDRSSQDQDLGSPRIPESARIRGRERGASTSFLFAHAKGKELITTIACHGTGDGAVGGAGLKRETSEYESIERQLRGKTFMGGLIKPPVVRQFLHKDHLFKEEEERGISHFELFADLVFVAIVHVLGEVAAEEATIFNALKFILMFWPSWSIWADMRSYLNVSGTDDFIQRAYILITSFLLIGYTAQSASIEIEYHGEVQSIGEALTATEGETTTASVIIRATHMIPRMLNALSERATEAIEESNTDSGFPYGIAIISEEGYAALRAATAFFLLAKSMRLFLLFFYGWHLPRFRAAHWVQAFFTLIPCLILLRLFFVDQVIDAMVVFIVGVTVEIAGKYLVGVIVHMGSTNKRRHQFFIPALEIGHVIEKTTAFFVLVTGEILMAVAYVAGDMKEIGLHGEFIRSCLGVTLAFLLCWLYFDADSCKVFVHALRRHWFSSITWTQLHLPLCLSLIVVASAAHEMIVSKELEQGIRWYFAIGMAVVLICISLMGFLHCSLDKPGSSLIPRWVRLMLRIVMAGCFCTFPLANNESSVLELGVYCAGLGAVVLMETIGKIGTVGNIAPPLPGPGEGHGGSMAPHDNHDNHYHQHEHQPPPCCHHYSHAIASSIESHSSHVEHASGVEYWFGRHKRYRRDDLTAYEKGEEDIGGDEHLGIMKAVHVRRGQRTGFAAF